MNAILLGAASLGTLAVMLFSPQPPAPTPVQVAHIAQAEDKGAMISRTVVEKDRNGKDVITEERIIAFND